MRGSGRKRNKQRELWFRREREIEKKSGEGAKGLKRGTEMRGNEERS